MTGTGTGKDLVVLVADRNMEAMVHAILLRPQALGIRAVDFEIRRHPERDCGCVLSGVEYLKLFIGTHQYALLLFDHEGCGKEIESPPNIEARLESNLSDSGWGKKSVAIVIEPELETWVWGNSVHVVREMGWYGRTPDLGTWLVSKGLLAEDGKKPSRPKEAVEAALREVRKPRSSALYEALGEKVSLARCEDRAFIKLKKVLKDWFGER
jgi:hypothetical protein